MKTEKEIKKALKEMEVRKTSYMLDMATITKEPNGVVYNTELIRNLEVTDAVIQVLKWVLFPKTPKKKSTIRPLCKSRKE